MGSAACASRCNPGQRTADDRVDGTGTDGLDALVAGRDGKCDTREAGGRSTAAPGATRWARAARRVGVYGWLGRVPRQHQAGVREKVNRTAGRGRACLQVWSQVCIATVIKRTEKKRVVQVTRIMTVGTLEQASKLLQASLVGSVLTSALIERFNATMRERLASLTRTCRHAAQRLQALSTGMY